MNNKQHQELVKNAVQKKFRGKTEKTARTVPQYPMTAEREMKRLTNAYVRLLKETLKENLPDIMAAYKLEKPNMRHDDFRDLEREIRRIFMLMAAKIEQTASKYGLDNRVNKVANMTKNISLREWKRVVHETLGVDLMEDYYNGSFYEQVIHRWVDENVLKIKSIPNNSLARMQDIVLDGFKHGTTIRDVTKAIMKEYSVTRKKAQSLARDQISTLNAQITKHQQTDAGCTHYRWSSSKDSRVRDCHRLLDGQTFAWDDPPEMWYMRKSGIVYTGRRCHPGQDFLCRCCAIPVFNLDKINLPVKEK